MQFTEEEIKTAVKVLMHSKAVRKWCEGEYRAFGGDPTSKAGKEFYYKHREEAARKMLK